MRCSYYTACLPIQFLAPLLYLPAACMHIGSFKSLLSKTLTLSFVQFIHYVNNTLVVLAVHVRGFCFGSTFHKFLHHYYHFLLRSAECRRKPSFESCFSLTLKIIHPHPSFSSSSNVSLHLFSCSACVSFLYGNVFNYMGHIVLTYPGALQPLVISS